MEYTHIVYVCVGLNVLNEMQALGSRSRKPSDCAVFLSGEFYDNGESLNLVFDFYGNSLFKQDNIIAVIGLILNNCVSLMLSLFDQGLRHSSGKFLIYMTKL